MAKEWWISNMVFGKQSWSTHRLLKTSGEEGSGKEVIITQNSPFTKKKWQEKEHHLKYSTFMWVWVFCCFCSFVCFVGGFCLFSLLNLVFLGVEGWFFRTIAVSWQQCFGKPFTLLQPWEMLVTNCRVKIKKPCTTFFS